MEALRRGRPRRPEPAASPVAPHRPLQPPGGGPAGRGWPRSSLARWGRRGRGSPRSLATSTPTARGRPKAQHGTSPNPAALPGPAQRGARLRPTSPPAARSDPARHGPTWVPAGPSPRGHCKLSLLPGGGGRYCDHRHCAARIAGPPDALRPAGTQQPFAETAPGHTRAPGRSRRTRQPRTRAPQSPRTPPGHRQRPPGHSGPRAAMSLPPPAGKVAPRLTRQPRARPAAGHRRALPLAPPRGRPRRAGRPGRGRRARAPLRCVAASPLPSMNGALSAARLRTGLALAAPRSAVPRACAGRSRGRGREAGRDPRWPAGGARPRAENARAGPHRLPSKGDATSALKLWAGVGVGEVVGVVPGVGALYNEHGLEAELSSTEG